MDYFKIISGILLIIFLIYFIKETYNYPLLKYIKYIKNCKLKRNLNPTLKIYHQKNIFLSICIPAYNMEKYIESALLSVINQSFFFFEVIIVNDNSNDNTLNIINQIQSKDKRIKIINHINNQGVYASRVDAILNSNGNYILLMDPDDILLNQDLFQELYTYNEKYNLDIIEFLVYRQKDDEKNIIIPKDHILSHQHNFLKNIINQPELSELIFYKPNTNDYSIIICRNIWNKLIRTKIMSKIINYLNNDYFKNQFLIAADDTPLNILAFRYAENYSHINIPGYLYHLRNDGMSSNNKGNIEHDKILSYNFLLYFKFLFKYISYFNMDINFFLYDFGHFAVYLYDLKYLNVSEYIPMAIEFFEEIKRKAIPENFRKYINYLIEYFSH